MIPAAHTVLREVEGGELVVAADFALAGRPAATVTELVAGLAARRTVWETRPPRYGDEAGMSGEDHVERWVRDVHEDGRPVRAVLGFCSGAVYAGAMHREIAREQDPPPRLVLLDPDRADRAMVIDYFEELMRTRLAAILRPDEVEAGVFDARDADAAAPDAAGLAGALGALCARILPPACRRVGLTGDRSVELARILASYLHWLAAAAAFEVRPLWRTATALNSSTPGYGLDAFGAHERAGLVNRVIQLDVPYRDLMRAPATARTVDDLLR